MQLMQPRDLLFRLFVGFLFLFAVLTGASIFRIGASRALAHVEVEASVDWFGLSVGLDLHNGWIVVALRHSFVRDELVANLGEGELGGLAALT